MGAGLSVGLAGFLLVSLSVLLVILVCAVLLNNLGFSSV